MLCAFNVYNYFKSALQKSFLTQRKEQKLNFKLKNQKKCVGAVAWMLTLS